MLLRFSADKMSGSLSLAGLLLSCLVQAQEAAPVSLACLPELTPAPDGFDFITADNAVNTSYALPEESQIDNVYITRLPIFDMNNPDESYWLYYWANRLHIRTQDRTVEQILLFEEGENFDQRLLQESSRLLRKENYYQDATIRLVSLCDDQVDVEVITRDTWSLTPGISFDRSGGQNNYSINLREANFLGKGKLLAVSRETSIDRDSNELLYDDNNLFGSRYRTQIALADNDDGFNQTLDIGLPFYSLDSRQSWQVSLANERRHDNLYFRAQEVSEVIHRKKALVLQAGMSAGLQNGYTRRLLAGYRYRRDDFSPSMTLPAPADFPADRRISAPFLAYEAIQDRYATDVNLNLMYRTEDLHLGRYFYQRIDFATEALGSNQDRVLLTGTYSNTLAYSSRTFWRHELSWQGRWNLDTKSTENVELRYESQFFRSWSDRRATYAKLEGVFTHNLDSNRQVLLGALTGARAFDNRYQVGQHRVILNIEERVYTDLHIFNLVRVAAAAFMDIGSAWSPGSDNGTDEKILADVGFGLRFVSSKSASNRIVHLDFAFPLTNQDDPVVDSYQIAFNIKTGF